MAVIAILIVGIILLVFGRKVFWLAGAALGFVVSLGIATRFFHGNPESVTVILVSLAIGLLGALLAVFVQKVAIRLVGFVALGFFAMSVAERFGGATEPWNWVVFFIGGIIGAVAIMIVFDWALILLSSIAGAILIVHGLQLGVALDSLLFVVLSIAGVLIQARLKGKKPPPKPEPARQS